MFQACTSIKEKARESKLLPIPFLRPSHAYHPRISNAEAHAVRYTLIKLYIQTHGTSTLLYQTGDLKLRSSQEPQIKRQFNVFPLCLPNAFSAFDETKVKRNPIRLWIVFKKIKKKKVMTYGLILLHQFHRSNRIILIHNADEI